MRRSADVLVVMAKEPRPGTVKTRLAQRVGAAAACALYRAFLADIAWRFAAGPWQLVWAVTPPGADLSAVVGPDARQIAQAGGDLAERMRRCFAQVLGEGAARVVMIGADVPHLADTVVGAAFSALDDHDAVFVPTRDGGYCLVGLRAPHDVFSDVPMGTAAVFEQTRLRLEALGLRWWALAPSFDIDELDDVEALRQLIARGEAVLPHTTDVLRNWS